jgi:hypothetical protein
MKFIVFFCGLSNKKYFETAPITIVFETLIYIKEKMTSLIIKIIMRSKLRLQVHLCKVLLPRISISPNHLKIPSQHKTELNLYSASEQRSI